MAVVECKSIITSLHALKRMISRNISPVDVKQALQSGEIIREYADDKPYPSMLVYKVVNGKQIHVVVGREEPSRVCVIITVYIADEEIWESDFKTKKPTK
jgi:hypothetical protein